jgi:hypothetical protein
VRYARIGKKRILKKNFYRRQFPMKKKIEEKLTPVSVLLNEDQLKAVKLLGDGYASTGVRRLIDITHEAIPEYLEAQKKITSTLKFGVKK